MHRLNQWHRTRTGYLVFGLIELGLAYVLASWAVDSGRLLAYGIAIVVLVGGLRNFFKSGAAYAESRRHGQ